MDKLKDKEWWKAVGTRVIRTAAETILGSGISSVTMLKDINLPFILVTTAISCVTAVLFAIKNLPETDTEKEIYGDGEDE